MVVCEVKVVLTNLTVVDLCNTHRYEVVVLYTLNLYNVICQLYLNKAENIEKQCLFPKTRNTYFEKSCPARGINEGVRY